jgi:hypothetical protein
MKGLEKELKSHEGKPASKGHKGLATGGVLKSTKPGNYATGGVVNGQGGYKKGGKVKMASGGNIDDDVKNAKSNLYMQKDDDKVYSKVRGLGPGMAARRLEDRGVDVKGLVGNRANPEDRGSYKSGGIIKSVKGNTKMVTAKPDHSPAKTGGVKEGNGGGYADGGTIKGGNWENRPANTAKAGKTGGTTGGVRKGNAGGFKEGGATKKAYATGGTVDTGKPVAMPKKPVSKPVANSMQSGTFAKGGKVGKFAEGDIVDASKGAYDKSIGPSKEEMDMAKAIRSIPSKLFEGAKSMMGMTPKPAGSVTKTEKSVTVTPAGKKRGGGC